MIRSAAALVLLGLSVEAFHTQPAAGSLMRRPVAPALRPAIADTGVNSCRGAVQMSASTQPVHLAKLTMFVPRRLTTFLSVLLTVICCAARSAFALETTVKSPASAAVSLVLSKDVLKWAGLGAAGGLAYIFRTKEPTHQRWAVNTEPSAVHDTPAEPKAKAQTDVETEDGLMTDLQRRMKELAEERERAAAAEDDDTPDDSSDEWGTGNTAVLEPPKPPRDMSPIDDASMGSVSFPKGFPLNLDEEEEQEPAEPVPQADPETLAMLNRMMGLSD